MKAIKILFLSVFFIFLINTVSAVPSVVCGEWNDNNASSIEIEDGDSVDFSAFFGTISPPMTINIGLYDSGDDLIHPFTPEDTVVNTNSFGKTYTVNKNIYSMPGDFQIRILGSDNSGEMSHILYLEVINYPPVIISEPVTEVNENEPYEYQVVAEDPDNHPLTYSLSATHGWLLIDSQTGLITGTAPDVSEDTDFSVSVVVSDGIDTDTQSYTLTVIWIPNPSLTQTLELVEDVNVDYYATLTELNSAVLEVYYKEFGSPESDYELIVARDITISEYNEIFDFYEIPGHEKTKGDYRFILEAVGYSISITDEINIPDYAPTVDLGSVLANFNEEDTIVINLPVPTDRNPEDEPVYINATSDEKTTADVNGNVLTLEGNRDKTGDYQVELEFGDLEGETATTTLEGKIYNLPDISGVLEDNEEDTGIQGVIRVYYQNSSGDYLPLEIDKIYDEKGTPINLSLGKIETVSDGTFSFQINEKTSELDEITLQARIGTEGDYQGYVRTIELSGDDHAGVLVRAVPYAPYEDNPIIFRQFMGELTGDRPSTRFDLEGEYLPEFSGFENYTGLIGIEILSENPFGAENGTFTEEEQINIRNKILNQSDISGIIGNYSISDDPVSIVNGSEGHFIFYEQEGDLKGKVLADPGWIIVVPYKNMPYAGLAEPRKAGGIIGYGGTVYLRLTGNHVISHEFGHIFIGGDLNQSTSMPPNQSVMIAGSGIYLQTTGPADKKTGKLLYEQTYMTFPPLLVPRVDYLYKILGLGFYGENQIAGTINEYYFETEDDDSDDDNFTGDHQNSNEDGVIDFDNTGSSNGVNADIPYDGTIYLQSDADKNNIITSLSNIIRQVISFISQKLRSVFSI